MTFAQRVIAFLFATANLASMTNVIAVIVLPAAIMPTSDSAMNKVFASDRSRLVLAFLATTVARLVNDFLMYGNIGMQRMENVFSNDIWVAPSESPF